jgi:hypothetical protein
MEIVETRGRVRHVTEKLTDGSPVHNIEVQPELGGEWLLFACAVSEASAVNALDRIANGLLAAAGEFR